MAPEREPPDLPDRPESGPGEYVGPARPIERDQGRPEPPSEPATEEFADAREPAEDDPEMLRPRPEPPGQPPDAPLAPPPPLQRPPAREPGPAPAARQPPRRRSPAGRRASERARPAEFPIVLRGYDRAAVDAYVSEVVQLVTELEGRQLPETVVQRALDDLGEETSDILKRAHAAAEEISARSRSHADGRVQRAEREAALMRREAEEQVRQLEADTRALWQERRRLIDDLRQLADDVLAVSDDALDRLEPRDETTVGAAQEPAADEQTDEPLPEDFEMVDDSEGETGPGGAPIDRDEPSAEDLPPNRRTMPPGSSGPGGPPPLRG